MIKLFPPQPERKVNIGRRVKRWRKHNGLTQKEAAAILKLSIKTIQDYEQGRRGQGVIGHRMSWFAYNSLLAQTKIERTKKRRKSSKKKS